MSILIANSHAFNRQPIVKEAVDHDGTINWKITREGQEIKIEDVPSSPAFHAIMKVHRKIQWPSFYLDDLYVHDRIDLYNWNPQAVVWVVRQTGTVLCFAREHRTRLIVAQDIIEHHYYAYRKEKIFEIKPQDAAGFFDDEIYQIQQQEVNQ